MNLGAKTAATASQRLLSLSAAFFVRLPHTGGRGLWCYRVERSPYQGLGQNAQTSLARPQPRTSGKNVCKHCSSSRKRLAAVATVLRFAEAIALLRQSVGICALTLSRCLCWLAETSRFSAIVHQLVVSSCGYYATNVNAT
jgi:hypothetical protein